MAIPPRRDHLTRSWVLISRGKNRFVDLLRTPNVSHHVPSSELLSERAMSKETEPCVVTETRSKELEAIPSRVRRLAANPVTPTARPVYFTTGTIPALERMWKIIPSCPIYAGGALSTISKTNTKLSRHFDQDERQIDAAPH